MYYFLDLSDMATNQVAESKTSNHNSNNNSVSAVQQKFYLPDFSKKKP